MSEKQEAVVSETSEVAEQTVESASEDFLQLQQEVPELETIADVPEAVIQAATEQNIPLLDAYLRYRFKEQRAVLAEQKRQQATAQATAGSLSGGGRRVAPVSDAFARSFEKALG